MELDSMERQRPMLRRRGAGQWSRNHQQIGDLVAMTLLLWGCSPTTPCIRRRASFRTHGPRPPRCRNPGDDSPAAFRSRCQERAPQLEETVIAPRDPSSLMLDDHPEDDALGIVLRSFREACRDRRLKVHRTRRAELGVLTAEIEISAVRPALRDVKNPSSHESGPLQSGGGRIP